jgi:AraC-like DNA-binding protein
LGPVGVQSDTEDADLERFSFDNSYTLHPLPQSGNRQNTGGDILFFVHRVSPQFSRYLPVNPEARKWEIWCNDAGYSRVPAGVDYPVLPENHPREYASTVCTGRVLREFRVVYITAGRGVFEADGAVAADIEAGDAFVLFPGVCHKYHPDRDAGWYEYWVGFSGDHANRLRDHGLFSPAEPVFRVGLNQEVLADYEQIIRLCRQQTPGFQVRLGALVLQLLAHIHAISSGARTQPRDGELVDAARAIMRKHLDDGLSVEDIAARIGIGYQRLLGIFKQYTGLTPYQYYLQLRIHRAKELLRESTSSIKEIAAFMNFENQYYFSRLFRKKEGRSPSAWRASYE